MCNAWCIEFARAARSRVSRGTEALEVGARDVNGSVRAVLEPGCKSYLGVDREAGKGVDRVLSVYELDQALAGASFDLVVSTEMLEHCADWRLALEQMLRRVRPGGHLLLTTRSPGFALHDWPEDHWRFSQEDLRRIFEGVGEIVLLEDDTTLGWACGVGVLVQRTADDRGLASWSAGLQEIEVTRVDPDAEDARAHRSPPGSVAGGLRPEERSELAALASALRPWLRDPRARKEFEDRGISLNPAGLRSPVPTLTEIASSFEYAGDEPPYAGGGLFEPGRMQSFLEELVPLAADFDPPRDGDRERPQGFFWNNASFGFSDAMACYAVLRRARPRRVVQIGSGFSMLVALQALADGGGGSIVCIDPQPRAFVRELAPRVELISKPIQAIGTADLEAWIGDGDVLLVESSHIVKCGSDCVQLYLRLLPALERAFLLQIQGVFLPFGYPPRWLGELGLAWNEQYLIAALLSGDPRWRVLYGSAWHERHDPRGLERLMHGRERIGGSSIWVERLRGTR